jgi:hypothetical protein
LSEPIQFDATVYKVQTLVDYGLRITLDLPETAIIAAAQLMALKREGMILHVSVVTEKQSESTGKEDGVQERRERKSIRASA